jgi:hypothetical protein
MRCKACNAGIKFIRTENRRKMPVDIEPITVIASLGKTIKAWIPHWVSCPKAEQFRRS